MWLELDHEADVCVEVLVDGATGDVGVASLGVHIGEVMEELCAESGTEPRQKVPCDGESGIQSTDGHAREESE